MIEAELTPALGYELSIVPSLNFNLFLEVIEIAPLPLPLKRLLHAAAQCGACRAAHDHQQQLR